MPEQLPTAGYCVVCGYALVERMIPSEGRRRLQCENCGHIHYVNPRVVTAIIVEHGGRILLQQRAIEPGLGKWTFPGGYVDWGEPVDVAAIRETYEETGLRVELGGLIGVYSYPGAPVAVVVYRARVLGGTITVCHECDQVEWVAPDAIPWADLAFPSTTAALRDFLASR